LTGAADAQIAVKKDEQNNVIVKIEYLKDGKDGDTFVCRLESVKVGQEPDGFPITSCVVVDQEGQAAIYGFKANPNELRLMRCILEAIDEFGVAPGTVPGLQVASSVSRVVEMKYVREKFSKTSGGMDVDENEKEQAKRIKGLMSRSSQYLTNVGIISMYKPTAALQFVWHTGKPVAGLTTRKEVKPDELPIDNATGERIDPDEFK
jgi:hypothetical protein